MPAAFVVFICLWIDGNLYGFHFLCVLLSLPLFLSGSLCVMAMHLFLLKLDVFDRTAPSVHYNHMATFIHSYFHTENMKKKKQYSLFDACYFFIFWR